MMSEHHGTPEQNQGRSPAMTFTIIISAVIFVVIMSLWVIIWLASPEQDSIRYDNMYPYISLLTQFL
jgi:flagellar basal body-associated protein FliL